MVMVDSKCYLNSKIQNQHPHFHLIEFWSELFCTSVIACPIKNCSKCARCSVEI